jgi:hypothetical protein
VTYFPSISLWSLVSIEKVEHVSGYSAPQICALGFF